MKRIIWLLPLALLIYAVAEAAPTLETICHVLVDPPVTMQVPSPAVAAHLGHGDYRGQCTTPPTATPTATNTAEPPTPTPTNTAEPPTATLVNTLAPTVTGPAPTSEPPERSARVRIEKMWLLTENIFGSWCVAISDTHPSLGWQQAWCGFPWPQMNTVLPIEAFQLNAPCAGPVYDNDVWACDDESLEWRQARWPDADWLHGLGRASLDELCEKYPDYCQGGKP
jgi:hypothetical protein